MTECNAATCTSEATWRIESFDQIVAHACDFHKATMIAAQTLRPSVEPLDLTQLSNLPAGVLVDDRDDLT